MGSDALAFGGLDRPRLVVQKLPEELPEGALADEADARAVRLVKDGETTAARTLAHLALFDLAQRHEAAR